MNFWKTILLPALQEVMTKILGILPNLLAALSILLIGWLVAKAIDSLVRKLLQRIGFNRMAEKAGISGFMKNAGFTREPVWVVGKLIFWLLMLVFILSAAETLQLKLIAETIQKLVAFIPNIIVVVFIVVLGAMFARFLGRLTTGAAKEAGVEMADFIGKIVNNLIVIIVVVTAINQLQIQSGILEITFAALLGAFALAIALTLGIGSKSIAQNIIAGVFARKSFKIGQNIKLQQVEGDLIEIGTVNARIRNAENIITVPNKKLIDDIAESTNKLTDQN